MSQTIRILNHLKKRPITALQALKHYDCLRLAARIADLRAAGHKIETTTVVSGNKRFAKYYLVAR